MPTLVTGMVNNEENNSICHAVDLPKDMPKMHHDRKINKAPNIMENQMDIQMLCPIPNPINNCGRITLNKNPLSP